MKHASTRAVHAYWDQRRGHRPAPSRDDIDPGAIRQALGDTFLLSATLSTSFVFVSPARASARCSAASSRARSSPTLCSDNSRKTLEDVLSVVAEESAGVVAGFTGHADDGATIELEMPVAAPRPCRPCAHQRARRADAARTGLLDRRQTGRHFRTRDGASPWRSNCRAAFCVAT